jgi:hypothetical protein
VAVWPNSVRVASAVALAVLAGALGAATADAGFTAPAIPVASGQQLNRAPDSIAVDGAGTTTIAWHQGATSHAAKARRVSAIGTVGPVINLSPAAEGGFLPVVASTAAGRTFAAWREFTGSDPSSVKGRWVEANGTLGPVLTLQTGSMTFDAGDLRIAVAPSGVATVAWTNQDDGTLSLRRISPGGVTSALSSDVSGGFAQYPVIRALPDGSTLAVWGGSGIETNTVPTSGTVGAPQPVSTGAGLIAGPGVAVDSHGNGLVVWRLGTGVNDYTVMGRRLDATGTPQGSEFAIDPTAASFVETPIGVGASSDGRFMATWTRQDVTGHDIVHARSLDSAGVFGGSEHPLSSAAEHSNLPVPALTDRGTGAVAWYHNENSEAYATRGRIVTAGTAAAIGGVRTFVPGGQSIDVASNPAIGLAAFLTEKSAAASAELFLTRFMVVPICTATQATVVQGRPVRAKVACAGPGLERAKIVAKPKHGKLAAFKRATRTIRYTPKAGYAGPDSFTYRGVNDGGASTPTTVTIKVGRDTVRPVIKSFKLEERKKGGFNFKLAYSERAGVRVTVRQHGERVGGVISKTRRKNATIKVPDKLRKLFESGQRYTAFAVANDVAGNRSKKRKLVIDLAR